MNMIDVAKALNEVYLNGRGPAYHAYRPASAGVVWTHKTNKDARVPSYVWAYVDISWCDGGNEVLRGSIYLVEGSVQMDLEQVFDPSKVPSVIRSIKRLTDRLGADEEKSATLLHGLVGDYLTDH